MLISLSGSSELWIRAKVTQQPLSRPAGPPPPPPPTIFRQVYLGLFPEFVKWNIPRPRQTLKIGPLLVARPYSHLHSKCTPSSPGLLLSFCIFPGLLRLSGPFCGFPSLPTPFRWVVVFDGTAPEKTGPKDGTKFCGPRKMLQT